MLLVAISTGVRGKDIPQPRALSVVLADLVITCSISRPLTFAARQPERQVQLASDVGLTTVLVGDVTLEEAAQAWSVPRLDVLLCGEVPQNPTQLLSKGRIREVLAQARDQYDYVIVD